MEPLIRPNVAKRVMKEIGEEILNKEEFKDMIKTDTEGNITPWVSEQAVYAFCELHNMRLQKLIEESFIIAALSETCVLRERHVLMACMREMYGDLICRVRE